MGHTTRYPKKKIAKDHKADYGLLGQRLSAGLCNIVINSVSNTGRKIQITRSTLTKFKRKFNNIWNPYGYELHMEEHNHIQNRGLGTHKNNIFLWV